MYKNVLFSAIFLLLSFFSLAQVATPEQQVLMLSARKFDWMVEKKTDSLALILDERVQYIHSNGWVQYRKDVIEDIQTSKLVLSKVTVEESAVRIYEHTAILNGKGTFTGTLSEKPFDLHLIFTEVYINKLGHWLLVSRHASKIS